MADRLFLDANVLFSAAYREGSGLSRIWELTDVAILSSHYAAEEARRNLPAAERGRLEKLLDKVHLQAQPAKAAGIPKGISLPEKDEPILMAALELRATHLLSGDRKAFGPYYGRKIRGVLVQRPADYLRGR